MHAQYTVLPVHAEYLYRFILTHMMHCIYTLVVLICTVIQYGVLKCCCMQLKVCE